MSLEGDIELLGKVPLFSSLPHDNLRLLAFSSVRRDLVAGEVLFKKGDVGRSAFVVSYGVVELATALGGEGGIRERCGRGALIGETALFVDTVRPGDARATNVSTVLEISREIMRRMLEEYPDAAEHFRAKLAGRLTSTITDLQRVRQALLAIES